MKIKYYTNYIRCNDGTVEISTRDTSLEKAQLQRENKTMKIKKLKKYWDDMTDEDQEIVQSYVNDLEMQGIEVTIQNPDGSVVEVI